MKYTKRDDGIYEIHLSEEEIDGLAKCSFYILEIEKVIKAGELRKKQALLESFVDFLLGIRNGFLQTSN